MLRNFLFIAMFDLLGSTFWVSSASACETSAAIDCGPGVHDASYQGGGVEVVTVSATACFTPEIAEAITLRDGSFAYTADFVYNPTRGTHEVIKTVKNQPCWTHNVAIGAWMAVYVTCRTYTGWVAALVTGPGRYTMTPVYWGFAENL
ncbi:MAG: hypothetical protein AUK16_01015 [Parcubacteria group bacterium CG2_30_44_11]|nr:MAG: hypothetical protein AUK16_01015 [Parcubacteria group bacterium CG2_30_44_11]